jgi:hypothetical protein
MDKNHALFAAIFIALPLWPTTYEVLWNSTLKAICGDCMPS